VHTGRERERTREGEREKERGLQRKSDNEPKKEHLWNKEGEKKIDTYRKK
jgi:hypothetical protein